MWPISLTQRLGSFTSLSKQFHTALALEKARPGTRAKKDAIKKALKLKRAAIVVKQEVFVPYKLKMEMEKVGKISPRRVVYEGMIDPVDNVYFSGNFLLQKKSALEAIEMHRETHHPTQFNAPHSLITAFVELAMTANKKTQFIDAFHNTLLLPHVFPIVHDRQILVFCDSEEMVEQATAAGATLAVGTGATRLIKNDEIDFKNYNHVLAHTSILPDIIPFRNTLKRRMPSASVGTAGADVLAILNRFMKGIEYTVVKDKYDHDYASIEAPIGYLDMPKEELEKNLEHFLLDVESKRAKTRSAPMITDVQLRSLPSTEIIYIDHTKYFPQVEGDDDDIDEPISRKRRN